MLADAQYLDTLTNNGHREAEEAEIFVLAIGILHEVCHLVRFDVSGMLG